MPFSRGILFFNIKVLYICEEIKDCHRTDVLITVYYITVDNSLLYKQLYSYILGFVSRHFSAVRFVKKVIKWYMGMIYLANCSRCQHQDLFCLKSVLWGMGYGFTVHWLPTGCFHIALGIWESEIFFILCEWQPEMFFSVVVESPTAYLQQRRECWCSFYAAII